MTLKNMFLKYLLLVSTMAVETETTYKTVAVQMKDLQQ